MRLRRLSPIFVCVVCFAVSLSNAAAADIEFVRVWPSWQNADAFDSISEHFTGVEKTRNRVVLRTQPSHRDGFYYLIRVANAATPQTGTKFALHVITPSSPDAKTYAFPVDVPARSTLFHLGLTGTDWPGEDTHPVAWKLDLLSADDRILATAQSFLWSKPAK